MSIKKWFIKLMKNELPKKKARNVWSVDESKCLKKTEIKKLKTFCTRVKIIGLKKRKFSPVRNWFMIELGLNTGLRVNEMASLKHSNLFIDDGCSSISLIGKGNKKRTVWISSDFKKLCQVYINYKQKFGYSTDEDSYLLNNLKGNKITKRSLQKFFKQILQKAELPERYYIHCLRHTYSTFLLIASNYNYKLVMTQLGHSSITTTQVYANVASAEINEAVEDLYK